MKKLKWNRKLSILVLIMFITVSFASFNTNLFIDGKAYVRVDRDIRITDIHLLETEYNGYENVSSEYTNRTISTDVSLPRQASSLTYEVTISNVSDRRYKITDIIEDSYDNRDVKYELLDASIGNIVEPHTTKTFRVKFTNNTTVVEEDDVYQTLTYTFDYTGGEQEFIVPYDGDYTLEVWGAQGGSTGTYNDESYIGGYGGYSKGTIHLQKNKTIYINVGGKGAKTNTVKKTIEGGYNGGGKGLQEVSSVHTSSGGGATSISYYKGTLNKQENHIDSIIIVAGGGGGSYHENQDKGDGGSAGGYIGSTSENYVTRRTHATQATGGSQSSGGSYGLCYNSSYAGIDSGSNGSFGQGGNYNEETTYDVRISGGGGGFYGGGAGYQSPGAGGSGYIGNTNLSNKEMYCYHCQESSESTTKTITTENHSSTPTSEYAKEGNGYAKITITRKIEDGSEYDFDYTGGEQTFTAPYSGSYKLEVWGSQGGKTTTTTDTNGYAGYGGYATGVINLDKSSTIYVNVGGVNYNGGGNTKSTTIAYGGGATHIALESGLLSTFENKIDKILIVAGGGGGTEKAKAGSGGGFKGTDSTKYNSSHQGIAHGGTQTEGGLGATNNGYAATENNNGSFGQGGSGMGADAAGGGGGGFYGGGGITYVGAGGGGSGYIGNPLLSNKIMYCYQCEESQEISTRTVSTNSHSKEPKQNQAKEGKGYSRITLLKRTINRTKLTLDFTFEEYVNGSEFTFGYTGAPQEFVVPKTGYYQIELWGASGNNHKNEYVEEHQVYGGYTSGKIKLNKGEILYIYVGGQSKRFNSTSANVGMVSGGATDIRLKSTTNWYDLESLSSRIMVAGGAGQVYGDGSAIAAGAAGGLNAYTILGNHQIVSPTQTSAGQGSTFNGANEFQYTGGNGSFGVGGTSANQRTGEGLINGYGYSCGAGGYYGGGGAPSGGSGNSFISGHNGCVAITAESDTTPRNDSNGVECANGTTDITCSKHYSDYVFSDTKMIDGKGYEWTTEVGTEVVGMPTHDGTSTMTGNDGDGFAKITCLEEITDYGFDYTGDVQEFVAPYNGIYKVELWGAQGGSLDGTTGLGGYTTGNIELSKNEKLYIAVGGEGESILTATGYENKGGYNGGGSSSFHEGMSNASKKYAGFGGGGATHISTKNRGELKNFTDNREEILMVAGGGGGDSRGNAEGVPVGAGGAGGGTISGHGLKVTGAALEPPENATQESGYAFGVGESLIQYTDSNNTGKYVSQNSLGNCGGGGGGGWYGGYTYHACRAPGASGGSGYIKSNLFTDYQMFCYQDCSGDNTTITEKYGHAKSEYANTGNGYARITLMEKFDTYKISYDLDGGTIKNSRKSYSAFDNDITLGTPTKEGYDFVGWTGGKNLFNKDAVTTGIELQQAGNTTNKSGWYTSEYIPVKPNTKYVISGSKTQGKLNCFYDENKEFVETITAVTGVIESPANAKYLRINGVVSEINTIQIEENSYKTDFEPYISTPTTNVTITSGSKGNRIYHAVWTPKYYIEYNLDGGTITNAPESYNVNSSSITIPTPTKKDYKFLGWTGGKNLLKMTDATTQMGGITVTIKDNEIILNGTTTNEISARSDFWKNNMVFNAPEEDKYYYKFTNSIEGGNYGFYEGEDTTTYVQGSSLSQGEHYFGIYIPQGITFNNFKTKPMVEKGYSTEFENIISTPTKNITIPAGSKGNRSYTAVWKRIVKLDVNVYYNGERIDAEEKVKYDVYVDGERKALQVSDYYVDQLEGSTYLINNFTYDTEKYVINEESKTGTIPGTASYHGVTIYLTTKTT